MPSENAQRKSLDAIDLKAAINAISDVIQNRPRPLREFDQIYMKAADMVFQSELVSRWADGSRLAFVGDGDSISVCVAYLEARRIVNCGPAEIKVYDFDERMVGAINRFADHERLDNLEAVLYNCFDPLPSHDKFDRFYTNPPWGASNGGKSVNVFVERGIEFLHYDGEGMVVIADAEDDLPWTAEVLANVQAFSADKGFYVSCLMPGLHAYHLDDNPELRSCNLMLRSRPGLGAVPDSKPIRDVGRLENFYGDGLAPKVRYVRERHRVDYGKAHTDEYQLELWEEVE
jgi:predicted methyltransferase